MKADQSEASTVASLLGLYLEKKEELIASVDKQPPDKVANRVSSFIRDLERPYTDLAATIGTPAHLVHHVLNTVAGAIQTMVAVNASTAASSYKELVAEGRKKSFTVPVRSRPIFFLWGVTVACVLAVIFILTNNPEPEILPVVMLIVITILATVGATTSSAGSKPPTLTPKVTLYVDVAMLDKRISHALRVADELLAAANLVHETDEPKSNRPEIESKRTFELLQALASHRITSNPEKEANDLAGDAIRILFNAKVTPVEYTSEQSHLFEQRPAGIKEVRTLLPALIDEHGELISEGVVLVPIT